MGRLSRKSIHLEQGVVCSQTNGTLVFSGPNGTRALTLLPYTEVELKEKEVRVISRGEGRRARENAGSMWALIRNAAQGAAHDFTKTLEIEGIGYKAAIEGDAIVLSLGYAHPVRVPIPQGVKVGIEKNVIHARGNDKELVGRFAAHIRALKKPEPYRGKGIRYRGEVVRRKAGKKAATAGAPGGAG